MWNQNICGIISRKVNWRGSILSYHVGILIPAIFLFWRHLHQRLFYMSMETMTINMKGFHRKAASALTIKYMCMKECASWDLVVPCDINRENINIQRRRVFKLFPKLVWRRGFDILVTHAPAYQLNDARDLPHQGFKIFLQLIEKYHPKFFLHGHVHMSYGRQHKRYDKYMDTYVINAFDRCVFEFETEDPEKDGQ